MPSVIYLTRDDLGHNEEGGYVVDASQDRVSEELSRCVDSGDTLAYFKLWEDEYRVAVNPSQVVSVEEYD